jgi:membrane protein YdbS with pleckstrin-like domain
MEQFQNKNITINTLPKYENISFSPLENNYKNVIYTNLIIFLILIGGGLISGYFFNDFIRHFIIYLIVLYFTIALFLFYINSVSFSRRGYALREKDIVYKSGVVATKTTIIPINRVQHVSINEGLLSRIFHLSVLQIFTAGDSGSHLYIPGLTKENAEKIKDFLLNKINSEATQVIDNNQNELLTIEDELD